MNIIKRIIKKTFIYPVLARFYDWFNENYKIISFSLKLLFTNFNAKIVYFFPYYHTGGAEKCHLDIVRTTSIVRTITFFTESSINKQFKTSFENLSLCFEIFFYLRKPGFSRWFIKNILIFKLNAKKELSVFGCNSSFYYEIIPRLSSKIKIFDLLHAFTFENEDGAEKWSLPCVARINKRIVINHKTKHDYIQQYKKFHVPDMISDRIQIIRYMLDCPDKYSEKDFSDKLKVLYVGRNGEEKRIHLIAEIASKCKENNLNTEFYFIGPDLDKVIDEPLKKFCCFTGVIQDFNQLKEYYIAAHITLITSTREGFPFAIMEAMAHGVVPVSTSVGGIPEQVEHCKTGFLIENIIDEKILIEEAVNYIKLLYNERNRLAEMSKNSYLYARNNFSVELFYKNYKDLFQL